MTHRWLLALAIVVPGVAWSQGQAPDGAARLTPGAVNDSLRAMRTIDRTIKRSAEFAEAWYRRGMILWALYERSRHRPPVNALVWQSLVVAADTSFRIALELEPDNDKYFLAVARFLANARVPYWNWGPYRVFDEAVERARKAGDPMRVATTAIEAGRVHLDQYDFHANCSVVSDLPPPPLEGGRTAGRALDYRGEIYYLRARLLFEEAFEAAPEYDLSFRHVALVLADQRRWFDLAGRSRARLQSAPRDGWAWMALGLATLRGGDPFSARIAFDNGLAYIDPEDRRRLDRIERVLGDDDRGRYAFLGDSARAAEARYYWRNLDPLWSVPGADPRLEFLARVAFAEIRWSDFAESMNGVNTDAGNHYIRTGTRMPLHFETAPDNELFRNKCRPTRMNAFVWNDTTVRTGIPARWEHLERTLMPRMRIDSIPAQVARFRAPRGSNDVVFAVRPPADSIRGATDISGPVRADFWILADGAAEVARDSVRPVTAPVHTFIKRLPPGTYIYRAEATADGSLFAGRSTAAFVTGDDPRTGLTAAGFGMSDVLITTAAEAARARPERWTDFRVTPLAGDAARGGVIGLIWEVYDPGEDASRARYGVVISLKRPASPAQQSAAGRVAASVVGGIAHAIGVTRAADTVEFRYEYEVPHAAVIVDQVQIGLGTTPPGTYLLTVQIFDRTTGASTGRSQQVTIADPPRRARGR